MSLNDLSINPSQASPFHITFTGHLLTPPFYRELVGSLEITLDSPFNDSLCPDVYNGVANPTSSSLTSDPKRDNFASPPSPNSQSRQLISKQVTDPTSDEAGAGAGPGFQGGQDAKRALKNAAGVVEAHPGILEEVNIPPLSNEEPGFDAPSTQKTSTATSTLSGGAKIAFGTVTGNQDTLEQGRQEYYGEKH
ncbi:hypothetical protein V565_043340 [Rhizoctonia solani 123E]|uniref:Uncharacterized protein n=1 Tax=Rhizoctonia solani 123E TaxID=1423351 RepID=A0A074RZX7_9AGAM|nr:hypothetical protein V565_043340 [Rhizoctonia solani 123E]